MENVRPTIVRLLSTMASAREIQLYLKRFSQLDADRFAVVKVGGAILRDQLEPLVSSLAFLQQVGLTPIVIHGAGPQLDEEMAAAGIGKQVVEGLRYTSPEGLAVVRRVMQRENLRLVEALQAVSVRATSITSGVFEAELLDREKFGLVGRVVRVDSAALEAAIGADSIPVIASLGETVGGQIVNVNADWAANELVKWMEPYKIIFLTGTGGILNEQGKLIESISLSTQYEHLMEQPWLHSGMRVKLEQIHDLLMDLPPATSLSITTPDEMAKELFTHRGSGTLVRRGEEILTFDSWDGVDLPRLKAVIESSFGRSLVEDYFETVRPYRVYVSEHYRAAIVLTRDGELSYMDKFAVSEEAQGEGLGRALWDVMRAGNPSLFWRSRRGNAINEFYFANADGARKEGNWTVFWYGIPEWDTVRGAVEAATAREATLVG
ncbi:MAG: acetylglutamate kinase [Gemmatimonadota bacterium]|nr:acetylglutamate kinase [Gemmatimonadota bacterium]MDH5758326.1 acetylglutamate kinase [Gemmatimonadota bacterium]